MRRHQHHRFALQRTTSSTIPSILSVRVEIGRQGHFQTPFECGGFALCRYTTTMASASLTPVHQPRELTLFCWILDISDRSFPVDIGDDRTVGHLKAEIVKMNPVSFGGVDSYELDLWEVSGYPPFSTYADNFPTRHPFRLTGNSRSTLANNSFLKMTCYWRETYWGKSFRCLNLQRRRFTSLYDIRVLVSHLFDPSLLMKCR